MVIILEICWILAWLAGRVLESAAVFRRQIAVLKATSLTISILVLFVSATTLLLYAFSPDVTIGCLGNPVVLMQLCVTATVVVPFFLLVLYKLFFNAQKEEMTLL